MSGYKSDFVLFPEYFNAPLMAKFNDMGEAQSIRALAIRALAQYTEEVRDRFIELAISYNINIITGSMPYVKEDGSLYNVGFLCRRDGSVEMYEKVHVTPDEVKSWGLSGGKMVHTFDTDCAKIGVLICYDVEFPELSRLMADQGMQILFVPFLTDTQNGYSRVRVCAQARAMCAGTCHRERVLCGDSRKCGQFAPCAQHGHPVCPVRCVHSLRFRFPYRRQACRSYAEHRNDSRLGCRS